MEATNKNNREEAPGAMVNFKRPKNGKKIKAGLAMAIMGHSRRHPWPSRNVRAPQTNGNQLSHNDDGDKGRAKLNVPSEDTQNMSLNHIKDKSADRRPS